MPQTYAKTRQCAICYCYCTACRWQRTEERVGRPHPLLSWKPCLETYLGYVYQQLHNELRENFLLQPQKFEHELSERLTRPGVAVGEPCLSFFTLITNQCVCVPGRSCVDRDGRRDPVHRGQSYARQWGADTHWTTRRRDERVCTDRLQLVPIQRL